MERIGQAVLADLNALRLARGRGGAVGNRVQAFKSVVDHRAAIHSTVQRRVDGVGVGPVQTFSVSVPLLAFMKNLKPSGEVLRFSRFC